MNHSQKFDVCSVRALGPFGSTAAMSRVKTLALPNSRLAARLCSIAARALSRRLSSCPQIKSRLALNSSDPLLHLDMYIVLDYGPHFI